MFDQVVDLTAEETRNCDQIIDIRLSPSSLPMANRCRRDLQGICHGLLRDASLNTDPLDCVHIFTSNQLLYELYSVPVLYYTAVLLSIHFVKFFDDL